METATQRLHRLTSYQPGRDWDAPADDPEVLHDLETNDLGRLPWFVKRYPGDLPRIRLLHLSAGVVRTMKRSYGLHRFRAAGSAGGRFPLEVYVAVPPGGPLPAGVHWYDPWDRPAVAGGVDAAPVEFPLVTAAQRAGGGDRRGPPWERGGPVSGTAMASAPVEDVIAARGSQRRMDPARGLSLVLLRTAMGVAVRGLSLPHWVAVHDVAGLPSGVYRWPVLDAPVRAGAMVRLVRPAM